jgi:hypothetical protein
MESDMNEEHVAQIKKAISDLESRIDERIENLCGIYDNKNIAPMIGTLITVESAFSAQAKLIMLVAEDEKVGKQAGEALTALSVSAISKVTRNLLEMAGIPDDKQKQLTVDIIGVLKVRRQCEDEIENILTQLGDDNED